MDRLAGSHAPARVDQGFDESRDCSTQHLFDFPFSGEAVCQPTCASGSSFHPREDMRQRRFLRGRISTIGEPSAIPVVGIAGSHRLSISPPGTWRQQAFGDVARRRRSRKYLPGAQVGDGKTPGLPLLGCAASPF